MERSKWKACVSGDHIRGFCRSHELHYKQALKPRNFVLHKLLKIDREVLLLQTELTSVHMAISVDGGRFKVNLTDLLFDEVHALSILPA
jgi:hypothetical protein